LRLVSEGPPIKRTSRQDPGQGEASAPYSSSDVNAPAHLLSFCFQILRNELGAGIGVGLSISDNSDGNVARRNFGFFSESTAGSTVAAIWRPGMAWGSV
jgi:hypothetical protein